MCYLVTFTVTLLTLNRSASYVRITSLKAIYKAFRPQVIVRQMTYRRAENDKATGIGISTYAKPTIFLEVSCLLLHPSCLWASASPH